MRGILADVNIEGQVFILLTALESPSWRGVWGPLQLPLRTFAELGLSANLSDDLVWQRCQQDQLVLITGNRNRSGADSLEATLRSQNTPQALPVLTVSDPTRILHSRDYTLAVVERLLTYLIDIDNYRGTGRLYLP